MKAGRHERAAVGEHDHEILGDMRKQQTEMKELLLAKTEAET